MIVVMHESYCCVICAEMLAEAGRKGFSITPSVLDESYVFFLQFRTVDFNVINKVSEIVVERAIIYCPWCGKMLLNSMSEEKLLELVEKNQHLLKIF